jgi:hypothetical protein
VLVSEPVAWDVEFRFFVLDRQVRTMSPYLRAGDLAQDETGEWKASSDEVEGALAVANAVIADEAVRLPPAEGHPGHVHCRPSCIEETESSNRLSYPFRLTYNRVGRNGR